MKKGYISEYFEAVAMKRLSAVDAEPNRSNQHEIGGKTTIGRVLGDWEPKVEFEVTYIWLGDEQESISCTGSASWYDTRWNQPHRSSEPRLYYPSNPVTEIMSEGDTLFIARRPDGSLFFIVTPPDSTTESQLLWLFGLDEQPSLSFQVAEVSGDHDGAMDFAARLILDELGIEYEDPEANSLEEIVRRFGTTFPKTKDFSQLARLTLPSVSATDDPDAAIMAWLDHEERMFRQLEKKVVAERMREGFLDSNGEPDVDTFIQYSIGVQQRRKSRMGYSFEHHLAAVFDAYELNYQRGAITERGNKPDFLFPNADIYHAADTDPNRLSMVGAKSTCKERWRQVTFEADKVERKHLITLEPAISEPQTSQMEAANVQLVLPKSIHSTYSSDQREWLWSLAQLIELLGQRQSIGASS